MKSADGLIIYGYLGGNQEEGIIIVAKEDDTLEKLETIGLHPFTTPFDPIETVIEGLFHVENKIRERALELAGVFKAPEFIEPLFHLAAGDTELEIRERALEALGQFIHEGKISDFHRTDDGSEEKEDTGRTNKNQFLAIKEFMLRSAEAGDWPSELRVKALVVLASVEAEEAKRLIDKFYCSEDNVLTAGAVEAISRLSDGDWQQIVLKELSSSYGPARKRAAVNAAGLHGITEAGPELIRLLENSDDEVLRRAAAEAIGRLNWPEGVEHLKKFQDDRDDKVQKKVTESLVRMAGVEE